MCGCDGGVSVISACEGIIMEKEGNVLMCVLFLHSHKNINM